MSISNILNICSNTKSPPYNEWYRIGRATWRKILYKDWFTIIDEWGLQGDNRNIYKIQIEISKTFSVRHGVMYQIKVPDFTINEKNLFVAISEVLRFLYRGGCPCYYRLTEELVEKGLWGKL